MAVSRKPFGVIKIGIVVLWIGLLGFMLSESNPVPVTEEVVGFAPVSEIKDHWFGVYFQNQKIGYLNRYVHPSESGMTLGEEGRLKLKLGESVRTVSLKTEAELSAVSELLQFKFSMESEDIRIKIFGRVDHGVLLLKIDTNGLENHESIPLAQAIHLPATLEYSIAQNNLQPGDRRRYALFDPMTLSQEDLIVEIEGREFMKVGEHTEEVLKIKGSFKGMTVYSWMTPEGDVLREESPGGMFLIAEPETVARSLPVDGRLPNLLSLVAVRSSQPISNPRSVKEMTVKLIGWRPTGGTEDLDVKMPDAGEITSFRLPYTGGGGVMEKLLPERFVQSDHPKIRNTTEEVLQGEADAKRAVRVLTRWVYESLEKRYTLSIPDALTVLELGSGDCNEHTVLFTAMARAAGVPTRMATGLVYLEDRFYYHAWPEVWLGQWVGVDPTFNQFPADATHLRFGIGSLTDVSELVGAMGRLEVEVVSYQ